MAKFRNVSGQDRDLYLPEWFGSRHVPAGDTILVEDDLAARYDFNQEGVWKSVGTVPDVVHPDPVDPAVVEPVVGTPAETAASAEVTDKKSGA